MDIGGVRKDIASIGNDIEGIRDEVWTGGNEGVGKGTKGVSARKEMRVFGNDVGGIGNEVVNSGMEVDRFVLLLDSSVASRPAAHFSGIAQGKLEDSSR